MCSVLYWVTRKFWDNNLSVLSVRELPDANSQQEVDVVEMIYPFDCFRVHVTARIKLGVYLNVRTNQHKVKTSLSKDIEGQLFVLTLKVL